MVRFAILTFPTEAEELEICRVKYVAYYSGQSTYISVDKVSAICVDCGIHEGKLKSALDLSEC